MSKNKRFSLTKVSVSVLLGLMTTSAWSMQVNFCKVIRTFDEQDLGASPQITHEDCQGVAFLEYARDYVKASCWNGAFDLIDGKCEVQNDVGDKEVNTENSGIGSEEESFLTE